MTVSADNGEELLTTGQVAELLQVHPQTVRRWRYDGDLPYVQLGYRTIRHRRADVDQLLRLRRNGVLTVR